MNVQQMVAERDAQIFADFKSYNAEAYRVNYILNEVGKKHGLSAYTVKNIVRKQAALVSHV